MKPLFNDKMFRTINRIVFPFAIGISISTAIIPYLPSASMQHANIEILPFYDLYRIGALFGLHDDGHGFGTSLKKTVRDVYTDVPHHLNVVCLDGSRSFVAINDGVKTTFIDRGELYKNLYRLVKITQNSATFMAYGKKMTLRLGEPGMLSFKESVTEYVSDDSSGVTQNYVVQRSSIDRYTENMGETWKNITINEVNQNGRIVGFRVDSIVAQSPFALLGLKQGDVITGVDNKPLDSYAAVFAAYQTGLRQSAIKITILRNNQPKDLEYEISR
ncbi:MAG: PDZ domain-containing protein [Sulfuricurvum sp.]|nr:PDZ domain-containing protein [Sulfuricurvum sp.]